MTTKHLLIAAALLGFTAPAFIAPAFISPAFAGEGTGNPFPGPNAALVEHMHNHPHYSMGKDAPYNYFYKGKPVPLTSYKQAHGGKNNPYPFKMNGQLIRVQPAPAPAYAHNRQRGNQG